MHVAKPDSFQSHSHKADIPAQNKVEASVLHQGRDNSFLASTVQVDANANFRNPPVRMETVRLYGAMKFRDVDFTYGRTAKRLQLAIVRRCKTHTHEREGTWMMAVQESPSRTQDPRWQAELDVIDTNNIDYPVARYRRLGT